MRIWPLPGRLLRHYCAPSLLFRRLPRCLSRRYLAQNRQPVLDRDQSPRGKNSEARGCSCFLSGRIIGHSPGGLAMHKVSISQSIVDRVVARRGREHIFDDLVPAKTALVVVDMQNGFMLPEVGHAPCPMAFEIVPNINRLGQAVRDTGGAVVWIQTAYSDETLTSWSISYEMVGKRGAERRKFSLSPENKGYKLFPDLKVEPSDLIVVKN